MFEPFAMYEAGTVDEGTASGPIGFLRALISHEQPLEVRERRDDDEKYETEENRLNDARQNGPEREPRAGDRLEERGSE